MAPIKFEEHSKDKLNEREISPSPRAWDEISSKLDKKQKPQKRRLFWYGIAASFVGFLVVSLWYFNAKDASINTDVKVVDAPKEKIEENQINPKATNVEAEGETYVVTKESLSKEKKEPSINKKTIQDTKTAITSTDKVNLDRDSEKLWNGPEEIIDAKIAEVVAQVNLLEQNNVAVSDAEVDALLRQAQEEIMAEQLFREDSTVNATALLMEVEGELDKSFRDQFFETLKNGYLKVRTAIADRNN